MRAWAARISARVTMDLVPRLFVDDVFQGLACFQMIIITDKHVNGALDPSVNVVGAVERHQNVIESVKRMAFGQRLLNENVKHSAPNASPAESIDQSGFVNDGSAS